MSGLKHIHLLLGHYFPFAHRYFLSGLIFDIIYTTAQELPGTTAFYLDIPPLGVSLPFQGHWPLFPTNVERTRRDSTSMGTFIPQGGFMTLNDFEYQLLLQC